MLVIKYKKKICNCIYLNIKKYKYIKKKKREQGVLARVRGHSRVIRA